MDCFWPFRSWICARVVEINVLSSFARLRSSAPLLRNRVYRRSDREILEFGRRLFSFQLQPSRLIFKEISAPGVWTRSA